MIHTHSESNDFGSFDSSFRDLAPGIYRQRMIIEGLPKESITSEQIKTYLSKLSEVLNMTALCEPVTDCSDKFGWAGWIHWEESGAHIYAWDQPKLFFSVDIYTCSPFDELKAIKFTAKFFDTIEIAGKSI